jgi:beta-xylosidase
MSVTTTDARTWSRPETVVCDPPVFWSVGNVIRVGADWVMCVQDYAVTAGEDFAGDDARLWLLRSPDLAHWDHPQPMNPGGAQVRWTSSRRQIDPFLVEHDGRYWCLYKAGSPNRDGAIGLLVSDNLRCWHEAVDAAPVLSGADTPDQAAVENPCVVRHDGRFVLFFSPCRRERGIGTAWSTDLVTWRDVRYLPLKRQAWMNAGPNAPMVIRAGENAGPWLMVFHVDHDPDECHSGVLGLAWSEDLEHWTCA